MTSALWFAAGVVVGVIGVIVYVVATISNLSEVMGHDIA